jgi:bud site selection protein 31
MSRIIREPELLPPASWGEIKDLMVELDSRVQEEEELCTEEYVSQAAWSLLQKAKWTRSRAVYVLRFLEKEHPISEELYQWILENEFADRELMEMWLTPGFERLCCVECCQKDDPGGGCSCRRRRTVSTEATHNPDHAADEDPGCRNCWCEGCSTNDAEGRPIPEPPIPTLEELEQGLR